MAEAAFDAALHVSDAARARALWREEREKLVSLITFDLAVLNGPASEKVIELRGGQSASWHVSF